MTKKIPSNIKNLKFLTPNPPSIKFYLQYQLRTALLTLLSERYQQFKESDVRTCDTHTCRKFTCEIFTLRFPLQPSDFSSFFVISQKTVDLSRALTTFFYWNFSLSLVHSLNCENVYNSLHMFHIHTHTWRELFILSMKNSRLLIDFLRNLCQ